MSIFEMLVERPAGAPGGRATVGSLAFILREIGRHWSRGTACSNMNFYNPFWLLDRNGLEGH